MPTTHDATAPEVTTPETEPLSYRRRAEALAAHVVARLGFKANIDDFLDDKDFCEVAPVVVDAMLDEDDAATLRDEGPRASDVLTRKLTREEWRLCDRVHSADNAYALASLEAGILIGVELERARQQKGGR